MKTRELLALEDLIGLVNARYEQEITNLMDVLTSVGMKEVMEAWFSLDHIGATPGPEEEEETVISSQRNLAR